MSDLFRGAQDVVLSNFFKPCLNKLSFFLVIIIFITEKDSTGLNALNYELLITIVGASSVLTLFSHMMSYSAAACSSQCYLSSMHFCRLHPLQILFLEDLEHLPPLGLLYLILF